MKDIYIRAIRDTFGGVPYCVINDGDVSALAGAMSLNDNSVLGIAMGTSEAVGYVDEEGRITGWLNELAFVPVDAQPDAMRDEWSGDIGCGVKYFSQDGVIKLAPRAGIQLDESLSPAEKLKVVQKLLDEGSPAAEKVYQSIGVYLGHSLALYHGYYGFKYAQLQGRVMSGRGGDIILDTAKAVLADEYPELEGKIEHVNNYCIAVKEKGDDIVFLRKIVKGGADKSYGIQVAKLAGVPDLVITRAKEIVEELSDGDITDRVSEIAVKCPRSRRKR